jgi:hypothetical protein
MPKKKRNSKSLEKKVELLSKRNQPDNILFILKCAEQINIKFISIPLWLTIAIPEGLTITELKNITGIGIINVENTLNDLVDSNLVQEMIPTDNRRQSIFYALLPAQQALDSPSAPPPTLARADKDFFRYYNTLISSRERSDRSDIRGIQIFKKVPNMENEKVILEKGILREKKEHPTPRQKIIPIKLKIKKQKTPPASHLKNLGEDLEKQSRPKVRISYLRTPSKYPALRAWKGKSNPVHWKTLEWVGYWLYSWEKCYGQEDPTFVGRTLYRTIGEAKKRNKGHLDEYWSAGQRMQGFFNAQYIFKGDALKMKEYLDWLFEIFLAEADWLEEPIGLSQVVKKTNNYFLDTFKRRSVKVKKKNGKKSKEKWNHWGYTRD